MQEYCEQDVQVLAKLYEHILNQNYAPEALALEHEFQKVIFQQEQTGVHFDRAKAVEMYAELASKRDQLIRELQEEFPPKVEEEVFVPKVNNKTRGYVKGVPFIKKYTIPFNPSSRQHIAERLMGLGWQPSEFTETGQPMVDETVLSALPYPCCKKLVEYLELTKIIGMLAEGNQAWLKLVTDKDRIHGRVITNGAVTGRCTHNSPNLAQIPARGTYGHQCRELFTAPDGWTMLGCDASGLELRMLASYMARYDGGKYSKVILEGDIHTENQNAAGLPTRNDAKTFSNMGVYKLI
jgi:DNA polymerase I-like protein with 3'-5' exonuclease and polymerase domains